MITKTLYLKFKQCPRRYYYELHNSNDRTPPDDHAKQLMKDGYRVNEFAYKLFPDIVLIRHQGDKVNETKQANDTLKYLEKNTKYIAEASFIYEDLFCAVDILAKDGDGYDIYEVKATNSLETKHIPDVAFQKYVLQKCNLKINHCYIVHLNKEFIKHGKIDAKELFKIERIDNDEKGKFLKEFNLIETTLEQIRILNKSKTFPDYGCKCSSGCDFFDFCHKGLPQPSIMDLYGLQARTAHKWIKSGILTYKDVDLSQLEKNPVAKAQIETFLNNKNQIYCNKQELKSFLDKLIYPLYHLDFETMFEAIPIVDGTHPYQQVPFQYSLHIEYKDGHTDHKEFLGDKLDCRYELAKKLCKDIPLNVMSVSYNMTFEKSRLTELAQAYPDLAEHLLNIRDHMIDLMDVFDLGYYYNPKQVGRTSIKFVMPAIVPETAKAYKNLDQVHNGGEAAAFYPKLVNTMKGKDYEDGRKSLLDYCFQDTKSMVDVLQKLKDLCK